MTMERREEIEKRRDETLVKLQEVKIAIKTLGFLYPEAGGRGKPECAGVVLRRFFVRERDMIGFLDLYESQLREGA
ncbi:hypothetical protein ES707_13103 [subsurface metagenome]